MTGRRRVARVRVAAAVVTILLVTLAAIGYRLSDDDSHSEIVAAPLGELVAYNSGHVRVSDVQVATTVERGDDEQLTTRGLFVVVTVTLQASGRDQELIGDTQLLTSDGMTYLYPFLSGEVLIARPGFEVSQQYVYEVDPGHVDDLTLELWNQGLTFRYYQRTRTPLGITAANAADWVRAGSGRVVTVSRDDVVKGLS